MYMSLYNMAFIKAILLAFVVEAVVSHPHHQTKKHPHVGLNVLEIIADNGYPVERHQDIETEDGYLLEIHRIPHGKDNAGENNKPVAFLMHGLMSSSADWCNIGSDTSLAYLLADKGYDVWLGNARGTTWSKKHKTLNPDVDKKEFFDFSWHHIGSHDLPAMIDYVLKLTGQENLIYFGHSQGTTAFYVMASEKPEYNNKIRLHVSLAPIAYMGNMTSPIYQIASRHIKAIETLFDLIGLYELIPTSEFYAILADELCSNESKLQELCRLFFMDGDVEGLDPEYIAVIASNAPAGAASKQFIHYGQEIASERFCQYDYGTEKNLEKYGQELPPDYDVTKITAPMALYYAKADSVAATEDVDHFADQLPNLVVKHLIEKEDFSHLDFIFAKDVIALLYDQIFEDMDKILN